MPYRTCGGTATRRGTPQRLHRRGLASYRAVEALRLILLFIHLVGFALLLGGSITQFLSGSLRINAAMLWGAIIQVLSGIGLSAPLRGGGDTEPDTAKLIVKAVIGVLIFVMVFFSRKRAEVNRGHFMTIIALTLANAAVAVFWR
jgi:hypothetical protein